jgi:hypothetical protein
MKTAMLGGRTMVEVAQNGVSGKGANENGLAAERGPA